VRFCGGARHARRVKGHRVFGPVEGRQRLCYSEAYDRAQTGWVALCDADEIFVPATNFQTELARVEPEAQMIACPTWEGIWETDSDYEGLYSPTHARRRVKDTSFRDSFFGNTQLFEILTRDGLVGHVFGKYLLRKAIPKVRKRIHSAFVPDEEGNLVNLSKSKTAQMSLLHFDAISFSAWCLKHQKRVDRETLMTGNRTSRVAQRARSLCLKCSPRLKPKSGLVSVFQQFSDKPHDVLIRSAGKQYGFFAVWKTFCCTFCDLFHIEDGPLPTKETL